MIDKVVSGAEGTARQLGNVPGLAKRGAASTAHGLAQVPGAAKKGATGTVHQLGNVSGAAKRGVASLYDKAIDRILATPHAVKDLGEARELLTDPAGEDVDAMADQIQKVAVIVTPVLRRLPMMAKVPGVRRFPVILTAVTVANVARMLRQGVREVQVVGSYVAARLTDATGVAPDPDLVKKLTAELYLQPRSRSPIDDRGLRPVRLLRRWILQGALGRTGGKSALKAVDAVSRMDVQAVLADWAARPGQ